MYTKIVILLLAVVCFSCAFAQEEDKLIDCGTTNINCVCGIGETKRYVPLELKMYAVYDPAIGKSKCVATQDPYQACANISCLLSSNKSDSAANNLIAYFYPYEFTVPNGGPPHRFTRQSDPCHVPQLNNALVKCWKWPNWINCDISCVYGHALQDGKDTLSLKNINCRNTENIWKPHGFKDCEPFMNCKVQLVKPGALKCKEPLDAPAYCEISCLDYDQYEATGTQKYECVDDSFGRILPHCAVLKEKVPTIRRPN